jgi:class 3 adenylate cyclase
MRHIHFLLGDTLRERPHTIDKWVAEVQPKAGSTQYTLTASSDQHLEYASALLYDARLYRAMEMFQFASALAKNENRPEMDVLARMGYGRAMNYLRRYKPAEAFFSAAHEQAKHLSGTLIPDLAQYFLILNKSDGGQKLSEVEWLFEPRAFKDEFATDLLLESFRVYLCSRLCLRASDRQRGLATVEAFIEGPHFPFVAPIMQGLILRMRGILLDISNATDLARVDLKQSIDIFSSIGFRLGEVQAALSLARTHGPTDRKQTKEYLDHARQLLESTEPPTASSPEGRHMPGERADLYSRLGHFEFSQGKLEEAATYYKKDLQVLSELAADPSEKVPRAAAYAHRNLGRVLLAQHDHEEAAYHFQKSLDIFKDAYDPINTFSTLYSLCELWIETRSFPAVLSGIEALEEILARLKERPKERAMIDLIRAKLALYQHHDDTEALTRASRAASELRRFGPDFFYVQALMFQAETLQAIGDGLGARQRLIEARLCASNLEMWDLQKAVDTRLTQLGVPEPQIQNLRKTDLERQCELDGFVRRDLNILFADIRGFTAISQQLDGGLMAEFIYEFAGGISKSISLLGGLPVRFLGDCVMALFGVRGDPAERETTMLQAVSRTYEMFDNLRDRWTKKASQFEAIGMGFGVASGVVTAGRFGSAELSEFSVIGEAVNLASRLQGVAEDGELVLCSKTATALGERTGSISFEERPVNLKGFGDLVAHVLNVEEATRILRNKRRQNTGQFKIGETIALESQDSAPILPKSSTL